MEAPGITRRRRPRRPFLAPVWVTTLVVLFIAGVALVLLRLALTTSTTLVVLVHPTDAQEGQRLAEMFADPRPGTGLELFYVSGTEGEQTVAPLAGRLGRPAIALASGEPDQVVERLRDAHHDGTVLLASSTAAVPALVNALGGVEVPPAQEGEGYLISIPSIGRASVVRFRY